MQPAFLPPGALIVVVLAILLFGGLFLLNWWLERRRSRELREFAQASGYEFIARDDHGRPQHYGHFTPFGKGHSRYTHNILRTTQQGAPMEVFDYHYAVTSHSGKNRRTRHYHHKVCTIEMPLEGPDLTVQREHLGHKILDAFGEFEIDFESSEFSRHYWVRCKDRRFAYDVIDARTMEFMLEHKGWHWQWRGRTLMIFQKGRLRAAHVKKMTQAAAGFRGLLPRHLLAEARVGGSPMNEAPSATRTQ